MKSILNVSLLAILCLFLQSCAVSQKVKSSEASSNKIKITYRFLQVYDHYYGEDHFLIYKNTNDPSLYKLPNKFQEALERNGSISEVKTLVLPQPTRLKVETDKKVYPFPSPEQFAEANSDYNIDFILLSAPNLINEDSMTPLGFLKVMGSILTLTLIPYTERLKMDLVAVVYSKNLKGIKIYKTSAKSAFHIWLPYIFFSGSKSAFSFDLKSPVIDKALNEIFNGMKRDRLM